MLTKIAFAVLFAASEFQEPLKPTRPPAIDARTISAARLGHQIPKEARKAYDGAVKTVKLDTKPDVEAAVVELERAVTIDPEFADAHGLLGSLNFRLMRFDEAAVAYRRAIAVDPEFARWHSELGWALFGLHDDAGAQESARRALGLQPANASAHLLLGVLLSPAAATRPEGLWHLTEGSYYLQRPR